MKNYDRKSRAGFTLLEVLVVVLIITILASFVGVQVARKPGEARVAAATAQIQAFKTALKLYRMEQSRYPTQEQGLQALCEKPTAGPIPARYPEDGYLDSRTLPLDPWKNPYVYLSPGPANEPYVIISYGAKGEPGGEDEEADVTSLESRE